MSPKKDLVADVLYSFLSPCLILNHGLYNVIALPCGWASTKLTAGEVYHVLSAFQIRNSLSSCNTPVVKPGSWQSKSCVCGQARSQVNCCLANCRVLAVALRIISFLSYRFSRYSHTWR